MTTHSTKPKTGRPRKGKRAATHPYIEANPDFPLSYHKATGRFYKTNKGKRHYFGSDPREAKQRLDREWHYIKLNLPVPGEGEQTVADLIDEWLEDRRLDIGQPGGIKHKTWKDYRRYALFYIEHLGAEVPVSMLGPEQFAVLHRAIMEKTKDSPTVGRKMVNVARMPWNWGKANKKCDEVAMGSRFKLPDKGLVREKRHSRGRQTFEPEEIHAMLSTAKPYMRAAILLGINGGFTQSEIALLLESDVDLATGIISHLRPKTRFYRRVTLWPETVQAIHDMPSYRPARGSEGYLFTTRNGRRYAEDGANGISQGFKRLMDKHGIELEQSGFGKLRATHRTAGDSAKDDNASKLIMGHALGSNDTEEHYIRGIMDDRIKAVTDCVYTNGCLGIQMNSKRSKQITHAASDASAAVRVLFTDERFADEILAKYDRANRFITAFAEDSERAEREYRMTPGDALTAMFAVIGLDDFTRKAGEGD
ncbi:MAG: site-specific integrase [Planctomycetota bacterium]